MTRLKKKGVKRNMLKGIPSILSPELLKVLDEMGHSDEIVIADGNFPGASHAQRLIRLDGHNVPEILNAVLQLFPLDRYVAAPVALMEVVKGDPVVPVIWEEYKKIIAAHESKTSNVLHFMSVRKKHMRLSQHRKKHCMQILF